MPRLMLLALMGSSGCLFMDANVTLSPAPSAGALSRERGQVVLLPAVDSAHTRGHVGVKKNGVGMNSADVHSTVPVATWFTHRLRNELEAAGLTVLDTEESAPQVRVTVLDFFAEPAVGITFELHALVHAEVVVQLANGRRYARRFAQRRRTDATILSGTDYQELFEQAIDAWMAEAVPAIVSLIEDGNTGAKIGSLPEWRWLG